MMFVVVLFLLVYFVFVCFCPYLCVVVCVVG